MAMWELKVLEKGQFRRSTMGSRAEEWEEVTRQMIN
jgi:hypothetical protein